jgi:hypothetical protein
MDLSQIPTDQLMQMYQSGLQAQPSPVQTIQKLESNNAPDSSTITSTAGATGSMQVMPKTAQNPGFGIKPSDGTPEDTARVGREYYGALQQKYGDNQIAAIAYNMGPDATDKWLKNGAKISDLPTETLKYAYNFAQLQPERLNSVPVAPGGVQPNQPAGPIGPPASAAPKSGLLANVEGAGLQAANIAAGGLEALPIAGAAAYGLGRRLVGGEAPGQALQETVNQAGENFSTFSPENALNKLGVNTQNLHGTAGYNGPQQVMNAMFETGPAALAEGMGRTGELEAGMSPTQFNPEEAGVPALKAGIQMGEILAPIAHMATGHGMAPEDLANKLQTGNWDDPATEPLPGDFTGPPSPNEFAQANPGASTPFYPEGSNDILGSNRGNLRQGELDFEGQAANPPDFLMARENGDVGTPSQIRETQPFVDEMSRRVAQFNQLDPEQMDMFLEQSQARSDQFGEEEQPRALSQDEFQQTMENLASKEGTGFQMPEDNDAAYEKYLNTVADDQGGLFDRPTIAKNFVDLARNEAVDRFVNDHPIVKANQARVEAAQAFLETAHDSQTKIMAQSALARATDTLEKSQDNIAKAYKGDGRFGVTADQTGIIHMNMGAPIPDWIKNGIANMLKGLHGVVVRFLNRKLNMPTNLDNPFKVMQAALKKGINDAAVKSVDSRVNEKETKFIQKAPGLSASDKIREFVPDARPYAEAKTDLMQARDMDSNWVTKNVTSQGGIWASAMSKNPTVKWAFTKLQDAIKAADFNSSRLLTNNKDGLRTMMQKMNPREMGEIHARMDLDEGEQLRTDAQLKQMGFNAKQRAYYMRFHEVMGEVLNQFNDGLQKAGLPTMDKRVAYMASRFTGDFRSMIYQKGTKNPVGFVGAHTKWAVEGIKAKLEEQNPGKYDFEDTTLNRGPNGRVGPNMFQGYLNVLNHFELNDPEMKGIMDTYRQYFTSNAAKALQALQHAKDKKGVFGAEGKKAWLSQEKNAQEGMKSQLTYADHMIKWSSLQDAAGQIKEMMSDPDINQPNAKSYIKDYMANVMGQNDTPLARGLASLMEGVAERTGVGPSLMRKLNSGQKSALLQMWLGFFRIPHAMLTMTQFMQSNPAMAELVRSRGAGNFWGNSMRGFSTTMNMMMKSLKPSTELKGFDKDIWDYQQKNQVFNANLTSHLTDINSGMAKRGFREIMEANITYPEMAIRSSTFAIWAHTMKEAGMSTQEALGTAENLTRASLVDYRPSERPLVFGKMGVLGDVASTLTRFKMNQLSQHQYFMKEAGGGNFTPMAALLASSVAFAGVSGLMGFNIADQMYQMFTKELMGKPDTLKAVMLRNLPDWANYGMFSQLGINMQGSFSNADTIPENPWAAMFPTGNTVVDMAKSVGQAAYYHDQTSLKKLMYNFSPTSMKGIEENQMFSKDLPNGNKMFINPNTQQAQSVRTPAEQQARNLAFHPIQEAHDADARQATKEIAENYADLRERDLKRLEDKFTSGTVSQSDLQTFRSDWVTHRGDLSAIPDLLKFIEEQHLTANQRAVGTGAIDIGKARQLQDLFGPQGQGGMVNRNQFLQR